MAASRLKAVVLGAWALAIPLTAIAQEQPATSPPPQPLLPAIVVTEALTRSMTDRVIATGTIEPVEEIYVSPLVDGLSIGSLNADIGDMVPAGGTLAVLNSDMLVLQKSQYEASIAKAKAALAQSEAQLAEAQANADESVRVSNRYETLSQNGTIATATAEQAKASAAAALARVTSARQAISVSDADIKVAESQIADIDLRLARTSVKAPFGGLVSERTAKIGAIASGSGQPLFTLIRDGKVELTADVTEADLVNVAAGQSVNMTLAGGAATISGTVRLIAPTVDEQTRLGKVHITLNETGKARVGMYASAEIIIKSKETIALPLTAVTTIDGKSVARAVEDGVVRLVDVKTGIQDGAYIEIESGLEAGDKVVAKAGAYVRDGDRINPVASMPNATN